MNDLPMPYFTMETYLFPMVEEELGELTVKMKEFLRIVEMVKPSRFINNALRWCGLGRPMKDREKMLRAFFLKAVYDLPTTKGLIENLNTNPSLRRLCGWEYRGGVPSEATFSRAFAIFSEEKVCDAIHAAVVAENYTENAGIINTVEHCKHNRPEINIRIIIGGLHLLHASKDRLKKTAEYLNSMNLEKLILLHCTGAEAADYLKKHLLCDVVIGRTGDVYEQ